MASIVFVILVNYSITKGNLVSITGAVLTGLTRAHVFYIYFFRAFIVSILTYFVVYYFRMIFYLQTSKLENEYLKQENLKAQLASLRQQISPHFLFNSLNTLSSLSHENIVKEYVLKISEVYRYVLSFQERKEVLVKDELAFIQSYIYILESRFEEGLKINFNISSSNLHRKILPLALQLLVENAVKHNSVLHNKPLVVNIYDTNDTIIVENDFRLKDTMEKHSGIGLNNLAQRYKLTAGKEIAIIQNEKKFKVEIPFLP